MDDIEYFESGSIPDMAVLESPRPKREDPPWRTCE